MGEQTGPISLRERIRGGLAIAGYAAFYTALALLFLCLFFETLGSAWAISALVVLGAVVVAAIVANYESVLDMFRTRRAAAGMSVALSVAAGLVILIAINWLSYRHNMSWDITEDRRFTLSDITLNWLRKLDEQGQDLKIVTFLPYEPSPYSGLPRDYRIRITDLLELYAQASPRISVVHTEPLGEFAKTAKIAQSIGIDEKNIPSETVVLKLGEKRKDVGIRDIFDTTPSMPWGPRRPQEAVFKGEDAITSAIRDLLDEKRRTVYFLVGHGERTSGYDPPDYSTVVEDLKGMNFEVKDLKLAEKGGVPEDADCLVIAGPTKLIPSGGTGLDELKAIEDYIDRGGNVIAMFDVILPGRKDISPSGLERLVAKYGIEVEQYALARGPEMILTGANTIGIPSGFHEISKPLKRHQAMFYQACCLKTKTPEKKGLRTWILVEGTEGSWGEKKPDRSARYDSGEDVSGPTILAAAAGPSDAKGETPESKGKLVVFADADFLSNQMMRDINYRQSANADLFLNSVNWMVGRRENVGIAPKEREKRTAIVTPSRRTRLFWGGVVGPAALMVILGIYVWRVRSR